MTLCSSVFRSGLQDVELSSLTVPRFIGIIVVHELSDLVQLSSCNSQLIHTLCFLDICLHTQESKGSKPTAMKSAQIPTTKAVTPVSVEAPSTEKTGQVDVTAAGNATMEPIGMVPVAKSSVAKSTTTTPTPAAKTTSMPKAKAKADATPPSLAEEAPKKRRHSKQDDVT